MKRLAALLLACALLLAPLGPAFAAEPSAAAKPQSLCPVLAFPINKSLFVDYEGKRIYFCCDGCQKEFNQDPAGHVKKMEDQGVLLEKTPGTK
jgi:YHS domain-containing protein